MESLENQLKEYIYSQIEKFKTPKGTRLYWKSTEQEISSGDESSIHTMIWTDTGWDLEDSTIENEFTNSLELPIPDEFKPIYQDGLLTIWKNEWNDTIQFQITDHTMYLTILKSGQY